MTAPSSPEPRPPLIRASELAQYGFCRRAWWLRRAQRWPPQQQAARIRGRRRHAQHARRLRQAGRWRRLGLWLLGGGGLLLISAMWLWLL